MSASHYYRLGVYLAQLAELSGPGDVKKLKVQARAQFEEALELHRIVVFPRGKLLPSQLQDIMRRIKGE